MNEYFERQLVTMRMVKMPIVGRPIFHRFSGLSLNELEVAKGLVADGLAKRVEGGGRTPSFVWSQKAEDLRVLDLL